MGVWEDWEDWIAGLWMASLESDFHRTRTAWSWGLGLGVVGELLLGCRRLVSVVDSG